MMQWLRRSFLAGLIVIGPLVISFAALVWVFKAVDGATSPFFARALGRDVPGLGLIITAVVVVIVGAIATNMLGRRLLRRIDGLLLRVPVFKTIYAPVKQLVAAFSPDNESGFKRVVLVSDARRGLVMGFLTREFSVDRGHGPEPMIAVFVPTNHLYLGDVVMCARSDALFPDVSVEAGIRIFLTGGMALPPRLDTTRRDQPSTDVAPRP